MQDHLVEYLGLLGSSIPPLGGVVIGDLLARRRRRGIPAGTTPPAVRWPNLLAYAVAASLAWLSGALGVGIPPVIGIVVAIAAWCPSPCPPGCPGSVPPTPPRSARGVTRREATHRWWGACAGCREQVTAPLSLTRTGSDEPLLPLHGTGSSRRDLTAARERISRRTPPR